MGLPGKFHVASWTGVIGQCCTFFLSVQHWQLYYIYCNTIMYIIYIHFYNVGENQVGMSRKYDGMKIKIKCQRMMTEGQGMTAKY